MAVAWNRRCASAPIAFMNPNLYLLADFEGARGGAAPDLRQTAERMIPDQVLFGSSFPLGPVEQSIANIRDWHLDPDGERKVLRHRRQAARPVTATDTTRERNRMCDSAPSYVWSEDHQARPDSLLIRSGSRVAPLSAERANAAYALSAWLTLRSRCAT
ncbi:hypothetical protein DSM100688_1022 [Bifidobacterium ramosum]|uniref:Uncharacterized protein n=1 Tax=Bifidobacterium ramosum TaxID=1798158 RepID=A0A6L4X0Y5_9BIFI|nr:hypothetical protein DSM100688_1022 [Bifidobacterium ramosum]